MFKYERFYKYALEVDTGYYVIAKYARKDKQYTCIKCEKECIVCDGEIKEKYIRHKVKVKGECDYFDAGLIITEKNKYTPKVRNLFHNASIVYLQNFLNKGYKLIITKKCKFKYKCENIVKEIKLEDGDSVKVEKSFYLNGVIKRGDLCILDKNENIKIILEIFDTHRTDENDRPNDIEWYELDVNDIMEYYDDDGDYDVIKLNCNRYYVCYPCENHRQEILKQQEEEYKQRQKQKELEQKQKEELERLKQKQKEELERIKQKQKEELERIKQKEEYEQRQKEKELEQKQKEEYEQRQKQKKLKELERIKQKEQGKEKEIQKFLKEEYEQRKKQKELEQKEKDFDNIFLLRIYFQLWYTTIRYPQAPAYKIFLIEKYDYHNIYLKHLKYNNYTKNYLKNKYQNDERYKKYMQEKSRRQYERKKKDILRIKMSS